MSTFLIWGVYFTLKYIANYTDLRFGVHNPSMRHVHHRSTEMRVLPTLLKVGAFFLKPTFFTEEHSFCSFLANTHDSIVGILPQIPLEWSLY